MTAPTVRLDATTAVGSLQTPTADLQELRSAVAVLRGVVQTLARSDQNVGQSAVRLSELQDLGLVTIYDNGTMFSLIVQRLEDLEARVTALEP